MREHARTFFNNLADSSAASVKYISKGAEYFNAYSS